MPLAPGTQLGAYEITGQLGAGGMGEVYRAKDTKLGRDVALKTLPPALADDADRLARFEREARLLASLNHAHIASVYELDEQDGVRYIAMELVDGQSLEDRLAKGALPVEDALDIGLQIASALEAAHGKGVVHRDLKPANVMLTPDGVVKVLDFGLAKAFSGKPGEAPPAHSPALSVAMTQQGLILGTAGYMSPEQASGQATDQRADIWSFGVVLCEMLTGLPVFSGESVPHILAGVLRSEPEWRRLPRDLHPLIRHVLERCLEKKPRDRYHSIADVRIDLEQALRDPRGRTLPSPTPAPLWRRALPVATAVLVTAAIAALVGWLAWPEPVRNVSRFVHVLPDGQSFISEEVRVVAVSADARRFVYVGADGLYLRELDDLEERLILGTPTAFPFFSPNGREIGFWDMSSRTLRSIDLEGSTSRQLAAPEPASPQPLLGSWTDRGTILFAASDAIYEVAEDGAARSQRHLAADDGDLLLEPSLLPDQETLLFTAVFLEEPEDRRIMLASPAGPPSVLIDRGSSARYVPPGYIVYALDGMLYGVRFDLDDLSLNGGAVPLGIDNVLTGRQVGVASYDIAADGTLVYASGPITQTTLVWVDRDGQETSVAGVQPGAWTYVQLSPDERRAVLDRREDQNDIWIIDDLEAQTPPRRLTFDPTLNRTPIWFDDDRVIYSRVVDGQEELFVQSASGTGMPEPLTADSGFPVNATDISNGVLLVQRAVCCGIYHLRLGDGTAPEPLLGQEAFNGTLSPDGRFIAYAREEETGPQNIYVQPYPSLGEGRWQISTGGGFSAEWSRDGSELFFTAPGSNGLDGSVAMMAVTVDTTGSFRHSAPVQLFEGNFPALQGGRQVYDVSADGQRFLMLKRAESREQNRVVIIQNWTVELERLLPVN